MGKKWIVTIGSWGSIQEEVIADTYGEAIVLVNKKMDTEEGWDEIKNNYVEYGMELETTDAYEDEEEDDA